MERPSGVFFCAALFFMAAGYLLVVGLAMLVAPGTVSMALGAPLLNGLEVAGPYMFLLMAGFGGLVGWGLLRLNNWARRVAAIIALVGLVMLIPTVSGDLVNLHIGKLAWGGLQIIVRVVVVWYLYQLAVREAFERK